MAAIVSAKEQEQPPSMFSHSYVSSKCLYMSLLHVSSQQYQGTSWSWKSKRVRAHMCSVIRQAMLLNSTPSS